MENFSYTIKKLLLNEFDIDQSIWLGGILTQLLFEKLRSADDDILKEINALKKIKVIWDYATDDEDEKSSYQIYTKDNNNDNISLFLSSFK